MSGVCATELSGAELQQQPGRSRLPLGPSPLTVLAMVLVLVAAGCSAGSENSSPTSIDYGSIVTSFKPVTTTIPAPTTTAPPPTTPPVTDPPPNPLIDVDRLVLYADDPTSVEAELETAYQRSWDAWQAAKAVPDPKHPDLELNKVGVSLHRAQASAQKNLDAGEFVLQGPKSRNVVLEVAVLGETTGVVQACLIADDQIYSLDDPETAIRSGLNTIEFSIEFTFIEGRWKSVEATQLEVTGGIGGCADSLES